MQQSESYVSWSSDLCDKLCDMHVCACLGERTLHAQSLPLFALSPYTFGPSDVMSWRPTLFHDCCLDKWL